ncbi:endonuclease 4-like [Rhododendron vialii]|uniref:endonuclease 4-like n=1 Tax=Rhododendron vialii TaxID=182163 RepID=UPI00265D975F|nr:endonuclease 4-like [Rhododendron vialii]
MPILLPFLRATAIIQLDKKPCVSGAINNYTMQLMSAYEDSNMESKYNLTEALMFLSHFIGDIHQPLHVGFTEDEGGNTVTVRWYRRKTNLHHDGWSNDILPWESCSLDQTACPDPYASESINLACKFAYRNATPGSTLEDDYFLSRLAVVEKRLAQGGLRLAATLNPYPGSGMVWNCRGRREERHSVENR